ncbi:uncharacterized protein LOC129222878 [Uloborus diversus]|uniref:uncharacterized protein LOC129222878 n=1 Tax=Uloborus diversus TaxID=327109 RepID=UPI0024090282|nr:uncharacterized protein LOC129222878 [Uloborus diversus]
MQSKLCCSLLLVLIALWFAAGQSRTDDDLNSISDKEAIVTDHILRNIPDMRMMLNGILRYENAAAKQLEDSIHSPLLLLPSKAREPGPTSDEALAALASGFLGSRGKRTEYSEIPVFANGFPAGRG